jgi:phage terminase large subunit-like protein
LDHGARQIIDKGVLQAPWRSIVIDELLQHIRHDDEHVGGKGVALP